MIHPTIEKPQYLTKAKLKERGWTDKLIGRFLSQPDKTKTNPHYKAGPPMCLYCLQRVEQIEASEDNPK